jgi:8-oxo-dGTP diphosphatase
MAVKAVIYDQAGRCLALRREPQSHHFPGQWDLPGGKVDAGEGFDRALRREVKEETGLRVDLRSVIGAWQRKWPKIVSVLLVVTARKQAGRVQLSAEHTEYRWIAPAELAKVDWSDEIRPVVEVMTGGNLFPDKRGRRPGQHNRIEPARR